MTAPRVPVIALLACALSDLAAVPLLLGSDDVPLPVGLAVAALAALTFAAAFGVARHRGWGRPLAFGTRGADIVAAAPALLAGAGAATTAAAVTVVLSLIAIATLLRTDAHAVRAA